MAYVDAKLVDALEWACRRFQRLTGRTNIWLAAQLTNLSIVVYFVWVGVSFSVTGAVSRIAIGLFCAGLAYALLQSVLKTPIETYESAAYRRVVKGFRNPRRVRDALLRISFLTLSVLLWYPVVFVYINLRLQFFLLTYLLIALTTLVLYLLACDPLPPCTGRVREWVRRVVPRLAAAESDLGAG
jgi:hypothetical protein